MAISHHTAHRIISSLSGGSSYPVLVETASGINCVVKWKCTGEGPLANTSEWIGSHLARHLDILVPTHYRVNVTADLLKQQMVDELKDLVTRSLGINLGVEYLEGGTPFDIAKIDAIDPALRRRIYLVDVLFLNIDRTDFNPNMLVVQDKLYCIDFAASMAIKRLMTGLVHSEQALLTQVRRHPFYVPGDTLTNLNLSLDPALVDEIIESTPDEWLPDAEATKKKVSFGVAKLLRESEVVLRRRLATLDEIPLETAEERKERTLHNRRAFEAKWGKF